MGWGACLKAAVQNQLFPYVKHCYPEFVHGLNSKQIAARFDGSAFEQNVCLDGSAFDSTQYGELRVAAETAFWRNPHMQEVLLRIFSHPENRFATLTPAECVDRFTSDALNFKTLTFIPAPVSNAADWDRDTMRQFRSYVHGEPTCYLAIRYYGTMSSGDPFTTLMNTVRNICYYAYYLRNLGTPYE